ncbi:hypothetical protein [Paenibacillus sp. MSJ-34]|uniref:hypothetical protein n=1 Tax=Paenibacillus sp. MSJ-34 TaxID=2841529 RepID=UPI001C112991|nr:hypothetical protein [Paenibacillus sp. MSJ-34]MBU5441911.1 hypothetical protein [Paenibacillus sp. MSJ-34]
MRVLGKLTKLIGIVVLASAISIMTAGYIVDSYIQSLLQKFNLQAAAQPLALSNLLGGLWGSKTPAAKEDAVAVNGQPAGTEGAKSGGAADETGTIGSGKTAATGDQAGSNGSGAAGEGGSGQSAGGTSAGSGLATGGLGAGNGLNGTISGQEQAGGQEASGQTGSAGAGSGNETVISREELANARGQLSSQDKEQLFSLLITKIPQEDLQKISLYVEDGLTESELKEIEQMIAMHVRDDEYDKLMNILKKY